MRYYSTNRNNIIYIYNYFLMKIHDYKILTTVFLFCKLLASQFEQEREQQQKKINELIPRTVPENQKNDYRYLIYKENIKKKKASLDCTLFVAVNLHGERLLIITRMKTKDFTLKMISL